MMRRFSTGIGVLCATLLAGGCGGSSPDAARANPNADDLASNAEAQPQPAAGDWIALFEGTDLDQWRGYQRQDVPSGWRIEDGTLAFVPGSNGGDLITRDQFADFELQLEWRISPGGNSGIMYRVSEDQQHPWQTGPEMQVLDDDAHADGQIPSHRAGALYDVIPPPENIARPVGEWNEARIVVQGNRIQQWLNGHQTADVEIGSADWNQRIAESKWHDVPTFASQRSGHIALQDHGDRVWYRNIRIRRLEGGR